MPCGIGIPPAPGSGSAVDDPADAIVLRTTIG
jgi:hypothetical protein